MRKRIPVAVIAIALVILASCTSPVDSPNDPQINDQISARVVSNMSDLPSASSSNSGQLFYVLAVPGFFYSNGSSWVAIDLSGATGATGASSSFITVYSSNTTITTANSPFIITGTVVVAPGATLTIQSGVQVILDYGCNFIVEGNLVVVGNSEALVSFTSLLTAYNSTIYFGRAGNANISYADFGLGIWMYMLAPDGSTTQTFDHCKFQASTNSIFLSGGTSLALSNCTFLGANSSYAISLSKGGLNATNLLFTGTWSGAIISGSGTATAIVTASDFSTVSTYAIMWQATTSATFTGNNFGSSSSYFIYNSSGLSVSLASSYFGGLVGAAVLAKIQNGGGSTTDISSPAASAYVVTGCGW